MSSSEDPTIEARRLAPQPARSGGVSDTVDASRREIVNAGRRLELIAMLSDPERFNFDGPDDAWGGEFDVVAELTGQPTEWVVERGSAD